MFRCMLLSSHLVSLLSRGMGVGCGGVIGKKWCQLLSLKGKLGGMNSTNINHYDFVCYAMREEIHINS